MLLEHASLALRGSSPSRDDDWREPASARLASAKCVPRSLRVELACARTLLDALENVLEREIPDEARRDVVAQAAEELARAATAIQQWASGPKRANASWSDHVRHSPAEP